MFCHFFRSITVPPSEKMHNLEAFLFCHSITHCYSDVEICISYHPHTHTHIYFRILKQHVKVTTQLQSSFNTYQCVSSEDCKLLASEQII